jgi:hypothetical protein
LWRLVVVALEDTGSVWYSSQSANITRMMRSELLYVNPDIS